jgi:hypothetical protein
MVSERITMASLERILGVDMDVKKEVTPGDTEGFIFRASNVAGEQVGIAADTEEVFINNDGTGVFVEDARSAWENC